MYDPLQFGKRELRTPDLGLRRSKNVSFPVIYTGIADLNFESEPNVSDAELKIILLHNNCTKIANICINVCMFSEDS